MAMARPRWLALNKSAMMPPEFVSGLDPNVPILTISDAGKRAEFVYLVENEGQGDQ